MDMQYSSMHVIYIYKYYNSLKMAIILIYLIYLILAHTSTLDHVVSAALN